jgi:hypothetical protein
LASHAYDYDGLNGSTAISNGGRTDEGDVRDCGKSIRRRMREPGTLGGVPVLGDNTLR